MCLKHEAHGRLLRWVSQKLLLSLQSSWYFEELKYCGLSEYIAILSYQNNLMASLVIVGEKWLRSQKDFRNISDFPLIYMGANWCPVVEVSFACLKEEM